jgi:hypothetical protein
MAAALGLLSAPRTPPPPASFAPALPGHIVPDTSVAPIPAPVAEPPATCGAPSLSRMHEEDDARDLEGLTQCTWEGPYVTMMVREQPLSDRCGQPAFARPLDLARLLEAAVPLDLATKSHVRAVFAEGRAQGRREDVFGVVGDSMSVERAFLRPFSLQADDRFVLSPEVRDALRVDGERTIIDVFRGVAAARDLDDDTMRDSFSAPRAARVGMEAPWALTPNLRGHTAIGNLIERLSPAYAIVMFGTNDAMHGISPPETLAADFTAQLGVILDTLESHGIVAILTTIPKHLRDERYADCPVKRTARSNMRWLVQTNALSAAVAELACVRHLPLIDFHYALDPLFDHGVGKDGVHPSRYFKGGGTLDEHGLACGYNVRNLVTLRMLAQVREAVLTP